jgi:hypothetical protein
MVRIIINIKIQSVNKMHAFLNVELFGTYSYYLVLKGCRLPHAA